MYGTHMQDATMLSVKVDTPQVRPVQIVSYWGRVRRRFLRQWLAVVAAGVLALVALVAGFAPWVAPHPPEKQFRREGLSETGAPLPPGSNPLFPFGTDSLGRDLLSRTIWGARISLSVGFGASLCAVLIALLVGGAAGYSGGLADSLIMRFVDFVLSLPSLFIILLIIALFDRSPLIVALVIGVLGWAYPARVFRQEVLSLKERDFVLAARALGLPARRIFLRHILPQMLSLVVVYISLGIPGAIFAESGLSYLGLGVPPPDATWGTMIQLGTGAYRSAPWVLLVPGLTLMIVVLCFNLVGTALREALDPTGKES
jgi:peptide/nickel transport system permease protein